MDRRTGYSPEVRERAVRMAFDYEGEYPSQWSAIVSNSQKLGCTAETLRRCVRQSETDRGRRACLADRGLRVSNSLRTDLALDALEQAL